MSETNSFFLEFTTNANHNYRGFKLTYSIKEYDHYLKFEKTTCKSPIDKFPTMNAAMARCVKDDPCVFMDDGCNNVGSFSLCRPRDMVESASNDSSCIYYKFAAGVQKLTVFRVKDVYKVPVSGQMTSLNVYNTCINSGMKVPCYQTSYADANCDCIYCPRCIEKYCYQTPYILRSNVFAMIGNGLCKGVSTAQCQPLQNVFMYMKKNGGLESKGIVAEEWKYGKDYSNKFALCYL